MNHYLITKSTESRKSLENHIFFSSESDFSLKRKHKL